jgi:hypothetical protein
VGGAPTYRRDDGALLANGITAVLDIRAERTSDLAFYDAHGISHQRFHVPDIRGERAAAVETVARQTTIRMPLRMPSADRVGAFSSPSRSASWVGAGVDNSRHHRIVPRGYITIR